LSAPHPIPDAWPFRPCDIHQPKESTMTSTQAQDGETRKARGRKDAEGQEQVIRLETITTRIDELVRLHIAAAEAAEDYNEAVKKAAEDSGLLASVVSKFVKARAGERYDTEKQKCEQLSLLFDEVWEAS